MALMTLALAAGTAAPVLAQQSSGSETPKVVDYAQSGDWKIRAIFAKDGGFNHCSAMKPYSDGTRVGFIAYASGLWRLQFYKSDWPQRKVVPFPARLEVDGRSVLSGRGFFRGRSAFIDLGRSAERVSALMKGKAMTIRSPSGSSTFSLGGTYNAVITVVRCWKDKRQSVGVAGGSAPPQANQGAFGNNATGNGAFGTAPPSQQGRAKVLSRAQTLDLATSYLSASKSPYKFLPANKNVLKRFPVNWRFDNGLVGGMKIFTNTDADPAKVLKRLLAQQAENCKGRSATEPVAPLRLKKSGRIVHRARGACETPTGSVLQTSYRVSRIKSGILMVVMHVGAKKLFTEKPLPPAGGGDREPAPNEL